jgi:hypothetical protein
METKVPSPPKNEGTVRESRQKLRKGVHGLIQSKAKRKEEDQNQQTFARAVGRSEKGTDPRWSRGLFRWDAGKRRGEAKNDESSWWVWKLAKWRSDGLCLKHPVIWRRKASSWTRHSSGAERQDLEGPSIHQEVPASLPKPRGVASTSGGLRESPFPRP